MTKSEKKADGDGATIGDVYRIVGEKVNLVFADVKNKTPLWAFIVVLGAVGPAIGYLFQDVSSTYNLADGNEIKIIGIKEKIESQTTRFMEKVDGVEEKLGDYMVRQDKAFDEVKAIIRESARSKHN